MSMVSLTKQGADHRGQLSTLGILHPISDLGFCTHAERHLLLVKNSKSGITFPTNGCGEIGGDIGGHFMKTKVPNL